MENISFVIPVYNEEANLPALFEKLRKTAESLSQPYEILFVDDGSNDGSLRVMQTLAAAHATVRYLSFARNCGQSAALHAGFAAAAGDIIITLDADLQNDPADIPRLLGYYGDYDLVNGWRHNRRDTFSKKVGSRIGNAVRNLFTRETIHDTGCSLKVMRAEMVRKIKMYRGLHRFLPTLMRLEGARVIEVKVNHQPRLFGFSKYTNFRRAVEGIHDLMAVRWMIKRHLRYTVKEKNI